ncbi:MAG TPA: haloacid dehalogenase type II [Afipia sp.]
MDMTLSRRDLLVGAAAITMVGQAQAQIAEPAKPDLSKIKALTFDLQGSTVDFYQPVLRAGEAMFKAKNIDVDFASVSSEWRDLYRQSMDTVLAGKAPYTRVDRIYRAGLDTLLERRGLADKFTPAERDELNAAWNRMDPWPDTIEGMTILQKRFTLATLTNASMPAAIAIVKHAGLPFDAVLTGELAQSYKPAPAVYQLAVNYLDCQPDEILMVACHKYDLKAAHAFGMKTAFVARPLEFGPAGKPDTKPDPLFDLNVDGFVTLAKALGA